MSAKLQGKIHRYNIIAYAKAIGIVASNNALRTAKHLWLALAEHYNDESGQCNPSIPTLMSCIELSHGPTVSAKNLLIKLGLLAVLKNAKGGRYSSSYELHFPRFEEFSRPANRTASHPTKRIPQNKEEDASHPAVKYQPSDIQEVSTPVGGTRTLIETLDIPLINNLRNSKNKEEEKRETVRLGIKYQAPIDAATGVWQIQEYLIQKVTEQKIKNL